MITVSDEDGGVAQVGGFPCLLVFHDYFADEVFVELASCNVDLPSALVASHPLLPLFICEVWLLVSDFRWVRLVWAD